VVVRGIDTRKGGVVSLFAVLLGTGALIAVMALAFDFGRVYREQQELRNSANAAALAVAWACAYGSDDCADESSAASFALQVLEDNANDGEVVLEEICGDAPLDACAPLSGASMDCQAYLGDQHLVRVTAATRGSEGDFLPLFFTPTVSEVDSVQLWNCAQAEWSEGQAAEGEFDTEFDLAFPICDYPGDDTPVVWFRFSNGGNTTIPREADCVLDGEEGGTIAFDDVMNGAASLDIPVDECDDPTTLTVGDEEEFGTANWRQLCDSEVEDYLDDVIDQEESIRVALAGEFDRQNSNNIDITIAGYVDIRVLGYRFSNQVSGGEDPPGGWGDYPPGVPDNRQCGGTRPCIYGYYDSVPSVLAGMPSARLIIE
jgi:Flp pilus assembly protein TadG